MLKTILKKWKEQSIKRFHPWVFSGAVDKVITESGEQLKLYDSKVLKDKIASEKQARECFNGELTKIYSSQGEFLAIGHFSFGSIMVRIISFKEEVINRNFWIEKIKEAYYTRIAIGLINNSDTNCYRLVHGEGDKLPGLIIDIYNGVAVIQTHSAGMFKSQEMIVEGLKEIYKESLVAVYHKSTYSAQFEGEDIYLYKSQMFTNLEGKIVVENGSKFNIDWEKGQKTGFFLDQRDNRELLKRYSVGKNILNLFCYTGGFSIYALKGGANRVDSVDSSSFAIDSVVKNLELNSYSSNDNGCYCQDAIDYLKDTPKGKYDLIIVDPPAFAKHLSSKDNALRAYKKLNALAIDKVARGGIVFTFSCSQVVSKIDFALAVFSAASSTGRNVKILHRLSQPPDHPVNIYHPEGEYLKGLVLYVD